MHKFQSFARPRCTQGFDDPKAHAAATVHRDSGRLINDQQMPILKYDGAFDEIEQALRGPARLLVRLDAHRRQAHLIAGSQAVFRLDPLAIDPDFALAQQAIDPASRHGLEVTHQEIVDPLS